LHEAYTGVVVVVVVVVAGVVVVVVVVVDVVVVVVVVGDLVISTVFSPSIVVEWSTWFDSQFSDCLMVVLSISVDIVGSGELDRIVFSINTVVVDKLGVVFTSVLPLRTLCVFEDDDKDCKTLFSTLFTDELVSWALSTDELSTSTSVASVFIDDNTSEDTLAASD